MNTLQLGRPGGGNAGFALDLRIEVEVTVAAVDSIRFANDCVLGPEDDYRLLLGYARDLWRKSRESSGDCVRYCIVAHQLAPVHVGLGSSAAVQCAVLMALNWMHGLPLREPELRALLASEYREVCGSKLTPAFTTGLSAYLNLYGGFAVLSPGVEALVHVVTPPWKYALVLPGGLLEPGGVGDPSCVLELGREYDRADAPRKAELIWNEIVPALVEANIVRFGAAIRRLQALGSKRAEIEAWGPRVLDAMEELLHARMECVLLSAMGPGIVVVSAQSYAELSAAAKRAGLQVVRMGRLDSTGLVIDSSPPREAVDSEFLDPA